MAEDKYRNGAAKNGTVPFDQFLKIYFPQIDFARDRSYGVDKGVQDVVDQIAEDILGREKGHIRYSKLDSDANLKKKFLSQFNSKTLVEYFIEVDPHVYGGLKPVDDDYVNNSRLLAMIGHDSEMLKNIAAHVPNGESFSMNVRNNKAYQRIQGEIILGPALKLLKSEYAPDIAKYLGIKDKEVLKKLEQISLMGQLATVSDLLSKKRTVEITEKDVDKHLEKVLGKIGKQVVSTDEEQE